MSIDATGKKEGMMDKMGGIVNTLLELPDKPESEAGRKAAHIVTDLLIIGLAVCIFAMLTKFDLATIADPSLTTLMGMSASLLVGGIGISWLMMDVISKKFHRTAGKIMAIIMPLAMFAGAACLIAAGFQHGLTHVSMGAYWLTGLLILPCGFLALGNTIKKLGRREAQFVDGPVPNITPNHDNRSSTRRDNQRRQFRQSEYDAALHRGRDIELESMSSSSFSSNEEKED